jgi:hypothetical protein
MPNCRAYDPTFSYEVAVILQDGSRRMLQEQEDVYYYVTVMNENYTHPDMPAGAEADIIKGMYLFRDSGLGNRDSIAPKRQRGVARQPHDFDALGGVGKPDSRSPVRGCQRERIGYTRFLVVVRTSFSLLKWRHALRMQESTWSNPQSRIPSLQCPNSIFITRP